MTALLNQKPLYVGSVKTLFQNPKEEQSLLFHFTDDYSVFDWGKMPDGIETKGRSLCLMGAYLMQALEQKQNWQNFSLGSLPFNTQKLSSLEKTATFQTIQKEAVSTHFRKLVAPQSLEDVTFESALQSDDNPLMQVQKVGVYPPIQGEIAGQLVYEYPPLEYELYAETLNQPTFIPLEVIFRFGLPKGSSLLGRLQKNPSLWPQYGVKEMPEAGYKFDFPVVEFYSKLEGHDRLLTMQEAMFISQLSAPKVQALLETCQLISLWLYQRFETLGIELWDGKLEFAYHPQEGFILVDTIGLDELRLNYKGVSLSKELLRDYYRQTEWYQQIKQVQEDTPEVFILKKDTLPNPERVPESLKSSVEAIYQTVLDCLVKNNLPDSMTLLDQLIVKVDSEKQQLNKLIAGVA